MLPSLAKGRGGGLKELSPWVFGRRRISKPEKIPKEPGRGADRPARRWGGNFMPINRWKWENSRSIRPDPDLARKRCPRVRLVSCFLGALVQFVVHDFWLASFLLLSRILFIYILRKTIEGSMRASVEIRGFYPKQSARNLEHTSLMGVVDALAVALAGLRSCCRPCRVHHQKHIIDFNTTCFYGRYVHTYNQKYVLKIF